MKWIKASERLPEDAIRERPIRANNLYWVAWYSEERKRWLTDYDQSFLSDEDNIQWLDESPEPEEWVSVETRLPEEGKGVLVFASEAEQGCKMTVGIYAPPVNGFITDDEGLWGVTHWMPLPKLPIK